VVDVNLFRSPRPTRHTLAEPPAETPEQAATVDTQQMKALAAELDQLDLGAEWWRSDRGSFVSAGHADGDKTIVGNSGGWWVVRPGPGGKPMPETVPSARDALAKVSAAAKVPLVKPS
jgi:hypothetical protein